MTAGSSCDPGLYVIERDRGACLFESVQPPPIFANIWSCDIDDGIQKRNGLRKHGGDVLSALVSHPTQTSVSIGIDIQRAADDVHDSK
jgi:hypothetical protein